MFIVFTDSMSDARPSSERIESRRVFGPVDEFGPLDSHILVVEVRESALGTSEDDEDDGPDSCESSDDATDDSPGVGGVSARGGVVVWGRGGLGQWGVGGGD
jgi:hypothetical protein